MNRTLMLELWNDDAGFIISSELVLVATILVVGLIVGLSEVQHAVVGELNDVSEAIGSLNQSYAYSGFSKVDLACIQHARTAGSIFIDHQDDCDNNECDIACDAPTKEQPKGHRGHHGHRSRVIHSKPARVIQKKRERVEIKKPAPAVEKVVVPKKTFIPKPQVMPEAKIYVAPQNGVIVNESIPCPTGVYVQPGYQQIPTQGHQFHVAPKVCDPAILPSTTVCPEIECK